MSEHESKPFWKTPAMWLVIGLPLASIVAGVSLLVIAVRSGGADAVPDDVQRMSQIQTTDLGPDAQARALGLSAVVRMADGVVEVIPVTGQFHRQSPLHPRWGKSQTRNHQHPHQYATNGSRGQPHKGI